MLRPVGINRYEPRKDLHICPGNVPSRRHRRKPVLPFGKILSRGTGFKKYPGASGMALRIRAVGIYSGRTSDGGDHVRTSEADSLTGRLSDAHDAADAVSVLHHLNDKIPVVNRHSEPFRVLLKRLRHVP